MQAGFALTSDDVAVARDDIRAGELLLIERAVPVVRGIEVPKELPVRVEREKQWNEWEKVKHKMPPCFVSFDNLQQLQLLRGTFAYEGGWALSPLASLLNSDRAVNVSARLWWSADGAVCVVLTTCGNVPEGTELLSGGWPSRAAAIAESMCAADTRLRLAFVADLQEPLHYATTRRRRSHEARYGLSAAGV